MINPDFLKPLLESLIREKITLCAGESCTGGMIQATITSMPGISAVFEGGIVSYSNKIKHRLLGVSQKTLKTHGAVSEATARAMLHGLKKIFKTRAGISVTGIAGPGGGSPQKPVGTVYIGCFLDDKEVVQQHIFSGLNRLEFQGRTTERALMLLGEMVSQKRVFEKN